MHSKILFILALLATLAPTLAAQPATRDIEQEKVIWDQLQRIDPSAVDDFKAGTIALDSGNNEEAVRRYESVRKKAPELDHVLRRLGYALAASGKVDEGIRLIETAVQKNRSPENLLGLARTMAYPGEGIEVSTTQKQRAFALAKEADRMPKTGDESDYKILVGELAIEFEEMATFRQATEQLVAKYPNLMVLRPGTDTGEKVGFSTLSATGGVVNAYAALKLAEEMSKPHP